MLQKSIAALLAATFLVVPMRVLAAEWVLDVAAGIPGEIRNNSVYELFIPDSIPSAEPIRGLVAVFNYEGGAEMYDDPRVREWAASENLGLIRHLVRNTNSQLTVAKTQGAVDRMFQVALPTLAQASGRPEVQHTSLIWAGLSQAGWGAISLGNLSESRTIGVLPIHDSTGDRDTTLGDSLDGLSLPTLHVIGGSDNVNGGSLAGEDLYSMLILDVASRRRANGGLTTVAVQPNAGHTQWDGRTDADLQFMLDWASSVVDLRVPATIPIDGPYALNDIPESSGFLGDLDLTFSQATPFVSVTASSIGPPSSSPLRDQWWLPNAQVGAAWRDYNATGSYILAERPFGDYNDDGVVDAADYTSWRDAASVGSSLPNDLSPGMVAEADYDVWRASYGLSVADAPGSLRVPEPSTAGYVVLVIAGALSPNSLRSAACRGRRVG